MLLAGFAECLVFGSLWAAVPALAFAVVLAARTAMEDGLLRDRLRGYVDYAAAVRYRLLPCVW
jgi:protein-S-isoprenylcysteine O-methyltransferase Ste14